MPLVDSFNLTDFIVGTPMGKYDGDVYRAYLARVKRAPEASQSVAEAVSSSGEVAPGRAPYFSRLIKPALEGADLLQAVEEAEVAAHAADMSDREWAEYATSIGLPQTHSARSSSTSSSISGAGGAGVRII